MSAFSELWKKLAKNKRYREEFVAAQVKRGIPFQIRTLLKKSGLPQQEIASRAKVTQGVISRAADPDYGNLTLNTIIRVAAGFDVAFVGKFVPFSELGKWFIDLSEGSVYIKTFDQENEEFENVGALETQPARPNQDLKIYLECYAGKQGGLHPFEARRGNQAGLFVVPPSVIPVQESEVNQEAKRVKSTHRTKGTLSDKRKKPGTSEARSAISGKSYGSAAGIPAISTAPAYTG